jgi:hypothetical protein
MNPMQRTAWIFGAIFVVVFALTNIPAFNDAQGYNFGLFKIDPIDNIVHFLTALICCVCAWYGTQSSRGAVLVFGVLYALDALVGLVCQKGLLDLSVLYQFAAAPQGVLNPDYGLHNFLLNVPHIIIASAMILSTTLFLPWVMKRRSFTELFMLWKLFDRTAW